MVIMSRSQDKLQRVANEISELFISSCLYIFSSRILTPPHPHTLTPSHPRPTPPHPHTPGPHLHTLTPPAHTSTPSHPWPTPPHPHTPGPHLHTLTPPAHTSTPSHPRPTPPHYCTLAYIVVSLHALITHPPIPTPLYRGEVQP